MLFLTFFPYFGKILDTQLIQYKCSLTLLFSGISFELIREICHFLLFPKRKSFRFSTKAHLFLSFSLPFFLTTRIFPISRNPHIIYVKGSKVHIPILHIKTIVSRTILVAWYICAFPPCIFTLISHHFIIQFYTILYYIYVIQYEKQIQKSLVKKGCELR